MIKGRRAFATITGIAIVAFTLFAFFFIAKEKTAPDWLALLFILIAECTLFGGVCILEKTENEKIFRPGALTVLGVYVLASITISFVFILLESNDIQSLVSMHLVMMALGAFIMVLMLNSSKKCTLLQDRPEKSAPVCPGLLTVETPLPAEETGTPLSKVFRMRNNPQNAVYEEELEKLHQAICFAEPPLSPTEECQLNEKLRKLETVFGADEDDKSIRIALKTNDILFFIEKRREIKNRR